MPTVDDLLYSGGLTTASERFCGPGALPATIDGVWGGLRMFIFFGKSRVLGWFRPDHGGAGSFITLQESCSGKRT